MEIVQVLPKDNYNIFVYFVDGKIKKYDVSHLVGKGVFSKLNDLDFYMNNCTVLNGTLAWTLDGKCRRSFGAYCLISYFILLKPIFNNSTSPGQNSKSSISFSVIHLISEISFLLKTGSSNISP